MFNRSVGMSALSVGAVTNNTQTITYSVFNLEGHRINSVPFTSTLQSGVTFQSAISMPDQNGQLVFSPVRMRLLRMDAATAEGASEC